jgi:hypothetical protein
MDLGMRLLARLETQRRLTEQHEIDLCAAVHVGFGGTDDLDLWEARFDPITASVRTGMVNDDGHVRLADEGRERFAQVT